jgi:hypothetical protein
VVTVGVEPPPVGPVGVVLDAEVEPDVVVSVLVDVLVLVLVLVVAVVVDADGLDGVGVGVGEGVGEGVVTLGELDPVADAAPAPPRSMPAATIVATVVRSARARTGPTFRQTPGAGESVGRAALR